MRKGSWFLVLLAGCGESERMKQMLPSSARAIMSGADDVRVFRLISPEDRMSVKDWPDLSTTAEATPSSKLRAELTALLLDPASYQLEEGKGCIPDPGVKLRFKRGAESVEAYICLQCAMIAFYGGGASGEAFWGNLDPCFKKVYDIIAKLFPNDEAIRKLDILRGGKQQAAPTTWSGLAAAIRSASAVDAWTIAGEPPEEKGYFDYAETSKQVALQAPAIRSLAALFGDPKNFGDSPKPCMPFPGVKIRYTRPDAVPVWVFICFQCAELFVYEGRTPRESKQIDSCLQALGAVMKKIFPDSESIQNLK
ncbi:MAG TPA: hypothetical protein VE981_24715 [Planctomycetota bacterium]|nr:hypothetical protein [Planctomycetota bacterium]